jgi:hypothetical protein
MASSSSSPAEVLDRILDKGEVKTLCDTCCPCGDIYVFASIETYLKLEEALGWNTASQNCPAGTSFKLPCCTDNCMDKLTDLLGVEFSDRLLDKGYVEFSLLGGKSMLCTLYDYAVQAADPDEAAELIDRILDKGVVFYCDIDKVKTDGDESQSVLASVETFLKWAEAVDLTNPNTSDPCQILPEPCCFSIGASVETYLKYAEAVGTATPPDVP